MTLKQGFPVEPLGGVLLAIDSGWSPRCESSPAGRDEWGVLKVSAVSWGRYRASENKRLSPGLEPRPEIQVRPGDLLLSRANTPELVGRSVLVRETPSLLMLSDKLLRLRVDESRTTPTFLDHVLSAPFTRAQIQDAATGSSRSMKNISQEKLRDVLVPVPPLPEQRKIAAILSSVDEAIEATQAVIDQLQVVKKAMMAELLTRGIPGRHTRFKMTEIGEVPEEWEVVPVEDCLIRIIDYRGKSPPKTSGGVVLITAKNVRDGFIQEDPREYIAEDAYESWMCRGIPAPGDVLFTTEAPLGKAAAVPPKRIALGQRLLTLCPDRQRVSPAFFLWLLLSPAFQRLLESKATGSTVLGIKQSVFRTLPVPVPSLDEQLGIGGSLQAVANREAAEQSALQDLHKLKSALMAVLLSGEVRVPSRS